MANPQVASASGVRGVGQMIADGRSHGDSDIGNHVVVALFRHDDLRDKEEGIGNGRRGGVTPAWGHAQRSDCEKQAKERAAFHKVIYRLRRLMGQISTVVTSANATPYLRKRYGEWVLPRNPHRLSWHRPEPAKLAAVILPSSLPSFWILPTHLVVADEFQDARGDPADMKLRLRAPAHPVRSWEYGRQLNDQQSLHLSPIRSASGHEISRAQAASPHTPDKTSAS